MAEVDPRRRGFLIAAAALAACRGPSSSSTPDAPASDAVADVRGLRIGVLPPQGEDDAAKLDRAAIEILRRRGATLVDVELPRLPYEALLTLLLAEAAAAFEPLTLADRDDALRWQGPDAWPNTFRAARFISAIDFVNADRLRRQAHHRSTPRRSAPRTARACGAGSSTRARSPRSASSSSGISTLRPPAHRPGDGAHTPDSRTLIVSRSRIPDPNRVGNRRIVTTLVIVSLRSATARIENRRNDAPVGGH